MSYHKTIVVGNLGRDPEMRYTPSGQAVTSFSVAVNEQYTDKAGEKVKRTIWYKIDAWGKLAETCNQWLKKGSVVLAEGVLKADPDTGGPRVYQKQDGTSSASFELTAQNIRFLGGTKSATNVPTKSSEEQMNEEDIPF